MSRPGDVAQMSQPAKACKAKALYFLNRSSFASEVKTYDGTKGAWKKDKLVNAAFNELSCRFCSKVCHKSAALQKHLRVFHQEQLQSTIDKITSVNHSRYQRDVRDDHDEDVAGLHDEDDSDRRFFEEHGLNEKIAVGAGSSRGEKRKIKEKLRDRITSFHRDDWNCIITLKEFRPIVIVRDVYKFEETALDLPEKPEKHEVDHMVESFELERVFLEAELEEKVRKARGWFGHKTEGSVAEVIALEDSDQEDTTNEVSPRPPKRRPQGSVVPAEKPNYLDKASWIKLAQVELSEEDEDLAERTLVSTTSEVIEILSDDEHKEDLAKEESKTEPFVLKTDAASSSRPKPKRFKKSPAKPRVTMSDDDIVEVNEETTAVTRHNHSTSIVTPRSLKMRSASPCKKRLPKPKKPDLTREVSLLTNPTEDDFMFPNEDDLANDELPDLSPLRGDDFEDNAEVLNRPLRTPDLDLTVRSDRDLFRDSEVVPEAEPMTWTSSKKKAKKRYSSTGGLQYKKKKPRALTSPVKVKTRVSDRDVVTQQHSNDEPEVIDLD